MHLFFEFPSQLTAEKFIVKLSQKTLAELISRQECKKTYYDSFDWRLYSASISCEFTQSQAPALLALTDLVSNQILVNTELHKVPTFAKDFAAETLRNTLMPILEMRALLPLCSIDYQSFQINILNNDQKIVVRLLIEDYPQLVSRLTVIPVKGYDKACEQLIETLASPPLNLKATNEPLLPAAIQLNGRKAFDYSSKLNIDLSSDLHSDIACKYLYSLLLNAMKANEQGVIADFDSEFLHDFRVAVRRTRAGLSQLKGVLPDEINTRFSDFFSWLGQITGPTRDLDVHLLNFENYKQSLPESIREDINPLYDFLLGKQKKAQQELAKHLRSDKYLNTLSDWEAYLNEASHSNPTEMNSQLSIKALADRRIWKMFNRILKEGQAITRESPPEALHELRKTGKKLRYLMEFFQSLYPEQQIKHLIKHLKNLQEVLGDFQDHAVQENNLKLFSEEMITFNTPANTFLAMGVLIQDLDTCKYHARRHFTARFADFANTENQQAFTALFADHKHHRNL
jgi:CHAD domain-containing protein